MLCVLIYPQIKEVAAIYGSRNEQITIPGKDKEPPKKFKEATGVFFSEPQFFHLFDFKLLAGDIKTALSDPNTGSHKRYIPLLQQVSDFGEAFRGAEVRYNEGVSTQVDYLIAKTNVDRARINLIYAKYDYIFQTKILDYYQGKLIL